ncbi:MAG: hypothetical protein OWT27_01210 [Firmicutes bacterium]|nr:hypothetical protein [Bacillota bacterium]
MTTGPRINASVLADACARLEAVAHDIVRMASDAELEERVMALFRAEDLEGLQTLMRQCRLERRLADDLQQFVERWRRQIGD